MSARFLALRFGASPLGVLANPFFLARSGLLKAILEYAREVEGRLLDVGCGSKPYRSWFTRCSDYIGVDIDREETRRRGIADLVYDGKTLPFKDGEFDALLCTQVLEHVFTPVDFLRELARVLRPGGRMILSVPFAWDEHEVPFDYGRYTSYGLRYILEQSGFRVLRMTKTRAGIAAVIQLWIAVMYKQIQFQNVWLQAAVHALLAFPLTLIGLTLGRLVRGGEFFYLDNVVLAERDATIATGISAYGDIES